MNKRRKNISYSFTYKQTVGFSSICILVYIKIYKGKGSIYVYIYAHRHIDIYVRTHTHTSKHMAYTYTQTHRHTHTHIHTYMMISKHVRNVFICMNECIRTRCAIDNFIHQRVHSKIKPDEKAKKKREKKMNLRVVFHKRSNHTPPPSDLAGFSTAENYRFSFFFFLHRPYLITSL